MVSILSSRRRRRRRRRRQRLYVRYRASDTWTVCPPTIFFLCFVLQLRY